MSGEVVNGQWKVCYRLNPPPTTHRSRPHDFTISPTALAKRLKVSDITDPARQLATSFRTPTVRLGVTGLSRAGKTVFITSLVRNLLGDGRLPFFQPRASGRIARVYLEPQPDDTIPRFAYEEHLALLAADPPEWPEGTRRISQLRLTFDYAPQGLVRRTLQPALGLSRLHLDIVDYPGEWLIDLPLLDQDYAAWSEQALADAAVPQRARHAGDLLAYVASLDPAVTLDEAVAQTGARLFRAYLTAARAAEPQLSTLGPGRFLMPGDLDGSPLLTFFPLPPSTALAAAPTQRGSLGHAMARRYKSYVAHVVQPFFRDHFSRLDRQIVLLDVLSALNNGPAALAELSAAMTNVLQAFRPGTNSWLTGIFRRRVDRIVFAATKADHVHHSSHAALEALVGNLTETAQRRASFAGAEVKALALAAIRATREGEVKSGREMVPCIIGTPLAGEKVAGVSFDGKTETALFPGDLPADPAELLTANATSAAGANDVRTVKFRPPRLVLETGGGQRPAPAHIRLDRALDFLIGDKLA